MFQTQMYWLKDFCATYETISVDGTAFVFGGVGEEMGENIRMFKLQNKGLSLLSNVGKITSCRVLFKIFNSSKR